MAHFTDVARSASFWKNLNSAIMLFVNCGWRNEQFEERLQQMEVKVGLRKKPPNPPKAWTARTATSCLRGGARAGDRLLPSQSFFQREVATLPFVDVMGTIEQKRHRTSRA